MTHSKELKIRIYNACLHQIDRRVATSREALQAAIEAGHEETKSSVGDKYETGRAMMQMEQEKYQEQLSRNLQLRQELTQIQYAKGYETASPGSLVITNAGTYFLAVGIGKLSVDRKTYFVLSPSSPLGKMLTGKKAGASFEFRNNTITISRII